MYNKHTDEGRLTITIHANDIYTVNENETEITISDQYREIVGTKRAAMVERELQYFLAELQAKWLVDVWLSKDPPDPKPLTETELNELFEDIEEDFNNGTPNQS